MGKDATGTAWFDDVGCGCDPWEMGVFNGNMEVPLGWMEWHAGGQAFCNTVNTESHSGEWSAFLHEWDNNDDEMVFYSEPAPVKRGKWYKISVWAKWDSVNTNDCYLPTNIDNTRDNDRLGMCFFFHKAPIDKSWDLACGGDQFFYFDQRADTSDGWVCYSKVIQACEEAAGISCRARFTSYPYGKVWYDDFSIEELDIEPNILVNGDLETIEPNFWNKWNEGEGGSVCTWDLAEGHNSSRSLKVEKPNTSNDAVGWISVDNSYLYWNHAKADRLYNLSFWAKTEGISFNPDLDEGIGVGFSFSAGGSEIAGLFIPLDHTTPTADWTEYTGGLMVPAGPDPDFMNVAFYFDGPTTGTVWIDDVGCGCDPWEMGVFNGNMEVPLGWMEWHAGGQAFCNTVNTESHSGEWSTFLHEWDDNDDELVFYSEPAPVEPGEWYKIGVWAKWDSINTADCYLPSNIVTDRVNERLGMCFFYHKAPLDKSWDLACGGDQFFYFDQRADTSDGWVNYNVITKACDEAVGMSCRARFTSYPVGKVWYDDFSIQHVTIDSLPCNIFDPQNYATIDMPQEYKVSQNYPNPFNPETTIRYELPTDGKIQIEVYNVLAQKVRTLFNGFSTAGNHEILWNGRDDFGTTLTSGIYFVTLRNGNFVTSRRVTLLK